ncbi:class I SAM-dependent methyltransferase [bacterium]|nr:class I SAM-dependent methyltransferase [bacterium]
MTHIFNPEQRHKLDNPDRRSMIPPEAVIELMRIDSTHTVLDIGAGIGYFAIPLLNRLRPPGKLIALDISDIMLGELEKKLPGHTAHVELIHSDAQQLPLEDAIADRVLLAFILHEFPDGRAYLKEICRVMKPGAELTVVEWKKTASPGGPPLEHRLTEADIEALSKGLFTHVQSREINAYQYAVVLAKP